VLQRAEENAQADAVNELAPRPGDALIIVDVQNDFLPGGALAVPQGDAVVAPISRYAALFSRRALPVFATRDWHPRDHCSFRPAGGPWPPHCVAGTRGAAFAAALELPPATSVISKAAESARDAYSGFQDTGLERQLRAKGVRRVFVAGLATDYCVLATVRDACAAGFEAVVLADAVRAVDLAPGDGERALGEMRALGARIAQPGDVAP
jgi:nicotinamidase/pyrazinamidase